MDLIEKCEVRRIEALGLLDSGRQSALGQFFTPAKAAELVASLPGVPVKDRVTVLDPGAGTGSLTAAMVQRLVRERPGARVHVVAVELDPLLVPFLKGTLADCEEAEGVTTELVEDDYIMGSTGLDEDPRTSGPFDLVIMNPPYGKLAAAAAHRKAVARAAVDCPNLYTAFWALGVRACAPGGQVVAIVPRSFANGVYFEPFRLWLLDRMAIDRLHVFESRSTVFADTGVLQENVIVCGTVGGRPSGSVVLSASVGHDDEVVSETVSAEAVVQPADPHRFIRFTDGAASVPAAARYTLEDLGLKVSTGRVVDFRARQCLSEDPREDGTVPLVYPGNVRAGRVEWPRKIGKPQAFRAEHEQARKQLVPAGVYTLVKRFSAKEERRRVVAGVWALDGVDPAFENHLNYIHEEGHGLPHELAHGLSAWLNSTPLDDLFRTFSGHTQVNASDLRMLPFPDRSHLMALGRAVADGLPAQQDLDGLVLRTLGQLEGVS